MGVAETDRQKRKADSKRRNASQLLSRRAPLLAPAIVGLLGALWAGLVRLGWGLPPIQPNLSLAHGPLMICGFLGTLISLERAVALGFTAAYTAPLLTGVGSLALIVDLPGATGPILIALGSLGLVLDFAVIIRRQAALFTVTMGLGAIAWCAGNALWLTGTAIPEMFWWWAGFLVLTIAGERLELSRMRRSSAQGARLFLIPLSLWLAGLAATFYAPSVAIRLCGAGMLALAIWLQRYDIAWRTIEQPGLTRFIASSLLSGYLWLAVSGLLWLTYADTVSVLRYDAMLHSLFLGFVFSMIFAHAPIIFPAVLGKPLEFSRAFYAHVILLHLSLAIRVGGDLADSFPLYQWGGMLGVIALLVFVANTAVAALRATRKGADGESGLSRTPTEATAS